MDDYCLRIYHIENIFTNASHVIFMAILLLESLPDTVTCLYSPLRVPGKMGLIIFFTNVVRKQFYKSSSYF